MTHYEIDYSQFSSEEEKEAKAMADLRDWFGAKRFEVINAGFEDYKNSKLDEKTILRSFNVACNFAGVEGYPVEVWYNSIFGKGEWERICREIEKEKEHMNVVYN